MRFLGYIAGALIAVVSALPAAALTMQAGPAAPTEYPLPPNVCDSTPGHIHPERPPCFPPNIDPRVAHGPVLPEHHWVTCCRPNIILPPPHYWRVPQIDGSPQ